MIGWNNLDAQRNLSVSSDIVCEFTTVMRMDYMVYFNFFGWVVVPLSIMIALYAEIFRVIRRQLNRRAEATCDGERYYRKELKLAKSLALVLFLFIVCWLPIHIMNCINFFCPECHVPKFAMYIGIFMSHVNSALNPLVYAFRIKRFRITLIQITRRCMLCKPAEPTPCPSSTPALTKKVDKWEELQHICIHGLQWDGAAMTIMGLCDVWNININMHNESTSSSPGTRSFLTHSYFFLVFKNMSLQSEQNDTPIITILFWLNASLINSYWIMIYMST